MSRIQGVPPNQILPSMYLFAYNIIVLVYWNNQSNFAHNSLFYDAFSGMVHGNGTFLSSYVMSILRDRYS